MNQSQNFTKLSKKYPSIPSSTIAIIKVSNLKIQKSSRKSREIEKVHLLKCKSMSHKSLRVNPMMRIFLVINDLKQFRFFLRTQSFLHF